MVVPGRSATLGGLRQWQTLALRSRNRSWLYDQQDRRVSGEDSIREVIAFPKNNKGADLMAESPVAVDFKQLRELYIQSTHKEKKAETPVG